MFNQGVINLQEFIIYLNGQIHTQTSSAVLFVDTWLALQYTALVRDELDFIIRSDYNEHESNKL